MSVTPTDVCTVIPTDSSAPQALYRIEPLKDPRWDRFLENHSHASVFHSTAWLTALQRTYGYDSIAYTTSPPEEDLQNGIVFCCVESWLTGRRLVSLPFSDHCALLVQRVEDAKVLLAGIEQELRKGKWRYIEMRPLESVGGATLLQHPATTYTLHQIDLSPDLDALFASFHKDSIQRKIRRAEREGLLYVERSDASLLDAFYQLHVNTRRRHEMPPPPRNWFRNLMECFGESLKIRLAFKGERPVAGMLTLRYKDTLVYKYGGADTHFNNLGATHLLYWKSIQDAKNSGLRTFDLGRSDAHQTGLITFKSRWGSTKATLTYARFAVSKNFRDAFDSVGAGWKARIAKHAFAHAPSGVLSVLGNLLYKHAG